MIKKLAAISNHNMMIGGGEHSFIEFLSYLTEPWQKIVIVPESGEVFERLTKKGIETHVIPLPSIRRCQISEIIKSLNRYIDICRSYTPSLIYANGSRAALYGGIVGKRLKIPVIWHCRAAESDFFLDYILFRLCNTIVVNSIATAKRFIPTIQSKVKVVYNGFDIKWLRDSMVKKSVFPKDDWINILVAARISKWKRHDVVLTAFEHVAQSNPKVHLICIGNKDSSEPEWHDYLLDRTKRSVFSNRIHWIGQVSDARHWYRIADLLVLASENEPFGRVIVEAMACGVPVVATRSGGIPEIVRHGQNGILVSPGNAKEMADAIITILHNESFRIRLSQSAFTHAEFFNIDTHVQHMTQIFDSTIQHYKS